MQNRRNWLRSTLSIAAGLPIGMSLSDQLIAAPVSDTERRQWNTLRSSNSVIKLNSNENPYGPSETVKRALQQNIVEANRYAFDVQVEMKAILANKEGVTPAHIAIGAGSGDLLCQAGAAFGVEGGRVLSAFPTFPLLINYATAFRATWDKVDLNDKLEHDYDAMAARVTDETKLVFVCNPNNPTGTLVDPVRVRQFCEEVSKRTTVYADEAYVEFLDPQQQVSMVELVKSDANVIVSKTFSKIYGLAGLRLGYVVGRPDLVKKIDKYHMGIANNQPALAAAKASLGDIDFMDYCRRKNAEARKHLTDYLDKKGIWYAKSHTNFVFFPAKIDAALVLSKLAEKGIRIRVWDYKDQQWFRVSIGTLEEMKIFTREFDSLV